MNVRIPNDFSISTDPIARSMFNDDLYDWWGRMLNLEDVHQYATGSGVVIAVLDSGLKDHPDLPQRGINVNFTDSNEIVNGHGTHVTGIINMQVNGRGYVGISPNAIVNMGTVLAGPDGIGPESWLLDACDWVLDTEPDILNMSLSFDAESKKMAKKIDQMQEKGILVVAAAGNNFSKQLAFPASHIFSLAVGAHDAGKLPANFSNTAKNIEQAKKMLLAPGVHVNSSWIDGNYRSASGSSMATPMVSGCAALIIELERNLGS